MAVGEIQINQLADATLPLRDSDLFVIKENAADRKVTWANVLAPFTAFAARTDNPHGVTKTQVGLGNVVNALQLTVANNLSDLNDFAVARNNLDVYSKAEVDSAVAAHANLTNNPHNVTKTQVGLSAVANALQLIASQNLADVPNKSNARANLDVYSKAEIDALLAGKLDVAQAIPISQVTGLQTALNGKVPTTRTVNGKALTTNINLTAADVGAATVVHNHAGQDLTPDNITATGNIFAGGNVGGYQI